MSLNGWIFSAIGNLHSPKNDVTTTYFSVSLLLRQLGFKNWHCVFPEDCTRVPKRVRGPYLRFLSSNIAFSWHNKRCTLIQKCTERTALK